MIVGILPEKPWYCKQVPGPFVDFLIAGFLQLTVLAILKRPPML